MVEVKPSDIAEFLQRDGGVGVIVMINKEAGTTQSELQHIVAVADSTLSKRLNEARDNNLVRISLNPTDHKNANRYVLTEFGRFLRVALESRGLAEAYQQYSRLEREIEGTAKDIADWIYASDDAIWLQNTPEDEFRFTNDLKTMDVFPGDDVPDDFISFIEEGGTEFDEIPRDDDTIPEETDLPDSEDSDVERPDWYEDENSEDVDDDDADDENG